ncbi:MAG TPA: ABC transporter permease [Candidatus Binatia bacterium]|nr:ABC transporter permease [Candidatus Binatia bacterium]
MKTILGNIARFFIRVSAFLRKEIFAVVRQPRLILTLVLGPFLILLLFGIGYRSTADPLHTLFVADQDNAFRSTVEDYANQMGPLLVNEGVVNSLADALVELRQERVDLVIELPSDPVGQVRQSQHPVFTLYHNEIDPYQVEYINAFSRIFADQVNRRILTDIAARSQGETASVQESVSATRDAATQMRQALEQGDKTEAMLQQNILVRNLDLLTYSLGASTQLLGNLEQQNGNGQVQDEGLVQTLASLRNQAQELQSISESPTGDYSQEIERVRSIEEQTSTLEEGLSEFRNIDPGVLASPFDVETQSISRSELNFSDFYVPSALALLAQHMALTFAALSIVREERGGTMELFRVSPLAAFEGLLGKYISYFILTGLLIAILAALSLLGLQVPMLGSWTIFALTLVALIFASLGIGFVISIVAESTSQAVQYAMIVLLASIFFGGFFLTLDLLRPYVRVVSWALPTTYGTQLLQDVMLRGLYTPNDLLYLLGLTGMGILFFVLALLLLQRKMNTL